MVEDCVNAVGVDVNTASPSLLQRVSGLTKTTAKNIVTYREENGAFTSRSQIKKVPKLGPKAFEQCAGFLRVPESKQVLDNTAVHPESYDAAHAPAGAVRIHAQGRRTRGTSKSCQRGSRRQATRRPRGSAESAR